MEGAIVTADAMSRQKKIVEKIIEQKADYTIGLKQNQPALYQETEDYFKEYAKEMPCEVTLDQGHGRIEKRVYRLLTDIAWLEQKDDWCGLQGLGMVTSTVTENPGCNSDNLKADMPGMSAFLCLPAGAVSGCKAFSF